MPPKKRTAKQSSYGSVVSASGRLQVFDQSKWRNTAYVLSNQTSLQNQVAVNDDHLAIVQSLLGSESSAQSVLGLATDKKLVFPNALVRRCIAFKTSATLNMNMTISVNGVEITDKERIQILQDIAGWAIEQRIAYGYAACRFVNVGGKRQVQRLQPRSDYTVVYSRPKDTAWNWIMSFPGTDESVGKVLLFMPSETAPDCNSGALRSEVFTAAYHLHRLEQLEKQCDFARADRVRPKSFVKLQEGSEMWKEAVMMIGPKNTDALEYETPEEIERKVGNNLKGVRAFIKIVVPDGSNSYIPLLPNMEVVPAPQAQMPDNATEERRALLQMILSIFGIPYNSFFPEDSQHTMEAYRAVEEIGNNTIQNLQNEIAQFLAYVYSMLYMEELETDLEANFLPARNPKPVTENEITEAQNQYNVVVSFNNNPHIDFDTLVKLRQGARNKPVISEEAFNTLSLKIHNLPLELMAESEEEFEPEQEENEAKRAKNDQEQSDAEETPDKPEENSEEEQPNSEKKKK